MAKLNSLTTGIIAAIAGSGLFARSVAGLELVHDGKAATSLWCNPDRSAGIAAHDHLTVGAIRRTLANGGNQ